jgi:thiamine biosynthesis lipoprotein
MDTVINVQVVGSSAAACERRLGRALGWFHHVERICSRFEEGSEVRRLARRTGRPVAVSPVLFAALRFAVTLAQLTDGAFDPTVGAEMERRGFDRNYRTGRRVSTPAVRPGAASYRDIALDERRKTVLLRRPILLDLGAVAKGLAVDLAARELDGLPGFAIDAGGDVYVRGVAPAGDLWRVGIRHPRREGALWGVVRLRRGAVCTSGSYARRLPHAGHHLLDARTRGASDGVVSATVIAPTAMAADALASAAFVLGPQRGLQLLEREGVVGLLLTPTLRAYRTRGVARPWR